MDFKIREKSFMARIAAWMLKGNSVAMTLGGTIYLYGVDKATFLNDEKWVLHEKEHIRQFQKYGFLKFIILYILETMKKGYYNNRFEIEARKAARE
jgi:hypothetical protein